MVGITEASAAVSGIKAAYDMARGVTKLTDDVNVKLATSDLIQALLDAQQHAVSAQQAQMELLQKIGELEAKLATVDDWKVTKARYVLHQFPAGAQAYVLREAHSGDEPYHRLCANCFEKGEKSILQTINKANGGERVECQRCDSKLTLVEFVHPRVNIPSTRY